LRQSCLVRFWNITLRLFLVIQVGVPPSLWANPVGGTVVVGEAGISTDGSSLTIHQLSDKAIIHWQDFSIAAGELTRFVQPSVLSAILNRVTGGNPSEIYGTLQGNGNVFLINPNGILIGPSGLIHVGGFVASTLNLSNDDFMGRGDIRFVGDSMAGVQNSGQIRAETGDVLLFANTVRNTGGIHAANGTVALAAGSEILLKPAGDERVFVQAGQGGAETGVSQDGQIRAAAAELKAAGGNAYAVAINNTGFVKATQVVHEGGRILLRAGNSEEADGQVLHSGTLEASRGDRGGEVRLLGSEVAMTGNSVIDVSGSHGGGTVYMGGGDYGQSASLPNASQSYMGSDARILANATERGDGGHVVVWSDDNTRFYGHIDARGGASGGDGGWVETSGGRLTFQGSVDASAPQGRVGTLLLDPNNITIRDNSGVNEDLSAGGSPFQYTSADSDSVLDVGVLQTQLNSGLTDVIVQTGTGGSNSQPGNITVEDAISWNSARRLTLNAAHDISVNAGITNAGSGGLTLNASQAAGGGEIHLDANIATGGSQIYNGAVVLESNITLNSGGSAITFNHAVDAAGAGETLTLNNVGGAVTFSGAVGSDAALGALTINGSGNVNMNGGGVTTSGHQTYAGNMSLGANTTLDSSAGNGVITLGGTVSGSGRDLTLQLGNSDLEINHAISGVGALIVSGTGTTSMNVASLSTSGHQTYHTALELAGNTSLTSSGGDVTLNDEVTGVGDTLTLNAQNVTLSGGTLGSLALNHSGTTYLGGGTLSLSANQTFARPVVLLDNSGLDTSGGNHTITFNGTVDGGHALTLTSGSGNITFNERVGASSRLGALTTNGSGITRFHTDQVLTTGNQTYNQAVAMIEHSLHLDSSASNGDITFNSTINGETVGWQSLTLSAGGGDVTFNAALGGSVALGNLTINGTGTTTINTTSIRTSGSQVYNQAVILSQSLVNDANIIPAGGFTGGADVTFNSTLNAASAGTQSLTINPNDGSVTFGGAVGNNAELNALTVNGSGTTHIDGGSIETTGDQTYNQRMEIGANATLTSSGGDITFRVGLESETGEETLTVNTPGGEARFLGINLDDDRSYESLGALTIHHDAYMNHVRLLTTHDQNYHGALVIGGDSVTLDSAREDGDITFVGAVSAESGEKSLLITNVGGGTVDSQTSLDIVDGGATQAITNLTYIDNTNGGITVNPFSTIETTGHQTYWQSVQLGVDTTLNAKHGGASGNIHFESTVEATTSGVESLTVTADTTVFDGFVGGSGRPLEFLDVTGSAQINDGGVTTTGTQDYHGSVSINEWDATLTSLTDAITFDASVSNQGLTVVAPEDITFKGSVNVEYLTARITDGDPGTIRLNGGSVTTNGDQSYEGIVDVGVQTANLHASNGEIEFHETVDSASHQTLNITSHNWIKFDDTVGGTALLGALSANNNQDDSAIRINKNIFTQGNQTYTGNVLINNIAGVTLDSSNAGGDIRLNEGTLGATALGHALTLNTGAGKANFDHMVGYEFVPVVGYDTEYTGHSLLSIETSGDATMDGSWLVTTENQTYHGNVTINGNSVTLDTTGAGVVSTDGSGHYNGGDIVFGGTVGVVSGETSLLMTTTGNGAITAFTPGADLLYINSHADRVTHLTGTILTSGDQTYYTPVVLDGDTSMTSTVSASNGRVTFEDRLDAASFGGQSLTITPGSGNVYFGGAMGVEDALSSLTVNGTGTTSIMGGSMITTGNQTYSQAVVLGANTLVDSSDSSGNVVFDRTISGAHTLTITPDEGDVTFGGAVSGLTGLTVNGTGLTSINGGSISTNGNQIYNQVVVVGNNLSLSSGGGSITFEETVDAASAGGQSLSIHPGTLTFKDRVGDGNAFSAFTLGGGTMRVDTDRIETTGAQTYHGAVVLDQDATFDSSAANGAITFNSTINAATAGAQSLVLSPGAANVTFNNALGNAARLNELTVNSSGTTYVNTTLMRTAGDQTYQQAVVLQNHVTFDSSASGGSIVFAGTMNAASAGGQSLTLELGAGDVSFGGSLGGNQALQSLTINGTGTTTLNLAQIVTHGNQTYNENLVLANNTTFNSSHSNGVITIGGVVNATTAGGQSLTLTSGNGNVYLNGELGQDQALSALTVHGTGTGTTYLHGSVRTTGDQTYEQVISLQGASTLDVSPGNGSIVFDRTVDGAHALELALGSGDVTFSDKVGDTQALASLTVTGTGTLYLDTDEVNTSGDQSYDAALALSGNTVLTSGSGDVHMNNTVTGVGDSLTIHAVDATLSGGTLGSVDLDNTGVTYLHGGTLVTTSAQTFSRPVVLTANSGLNTSSGGHDILFEGTINGGHSLTLNTGAGNVTLEGSVGGSTALAGLTINGSGLTTIDAALIRTTGAQSYQQAVDITTDVTLDSGGGDLTFSGVINAGTAGADSLTIEAGAGDVTFGGHVGATRRLDALSIRGTGTTAINGGSVRTQGSQIYGEAVTIDGNTTLTSDAGRVALEKTITGAAHDVVVNAEDVLLSGGSLNSIDLNHTGTLYLNGGTLTTAQTQAYDRPVVLMENSGLTVTGGDITFSGLIDAQSNGGQSLTLQAGAGDVLFGGLIGQTYALSALSVQGTGTASINASSIRTTGNQTYDMDVELGVNSELNTTSGDGDVVLSGTIDGAHRLSLILGAGDATFGGAVGSGTELTSLDVTGTGTTFLNGGTIRTTGNQTYGESVTLGADAALTALFGNVVLEKMVTGSAHNLTLDAVDVTLSGASLNALDVNNTGVTSFNGGTLTTAQDQSYSQSILLLQDSTLRATGGNITFDGTIDAQSVGEQSLTLDASGGNTVLNAQIGSGTALNVLTIEGTGTAQFNGGLVRTQGHQRYRPAVVLGADTVLDASAGNGSITFEHTVDGAHALTLDSGAGDVSLDGRIGSDTALSALTVNGSGTTTIQSSLIKTTGDQTYHQAVQLVSNTTLDTSAGNGDLVFDRTINGARTLTLRSGAGDVTLSGAIGQTTALGAMTIEGTGQTTLGDTGVRTTGNQTYRQALVLADDITFDASAGHGTISFDQTINSNDASTHRAMTVNAGTGDVTFGGALGNDTALKSVTAKGGTLTMLGHITATGSDGVLMVASKSFKNPDSRTIMTPGGRFLIYSVRPGDNMLGGLNGGTQYSTRYPALPGFSGNGFVYSDADPIAQSEIIKNVRAVLTNPAPLINPIGFSLPGSGDLSAGHSTHIVIGSQMSASRPTAVPSVRGARVTGGSPSGMSGLRYGILPDIRLSFSSLVNHEKKIGMTDEQGDVRWIFHNTGHKWILPVR